MIQNNWNIKIAVFPKNLQKIAQADGPQTAVCDTFGLNKFAHHVSQLRPSWKKF